MTNVIRALFVAWQNPNTRSFYPVARLAEIQGDECGECFEFVYINGAQQAEDFQPFASFSDLQQVYRSKMLFPLFANRLLSKSRSDFPEYLSQLGLPAATTNPVTILSRSSGQRRTDTLELFPLPEFEPDYGYRTWFWAHDIRHLEEFNQNRILQFTPDEQIYPRCDVENLFDPSPIELLSIENTRVGYMPAYLLDDAHTLQKTCEICEVFVEKVNPLPAPVQQRLLCRLESCWPVEFTPYASERYQPIPKDAASILPPVFED